VDAQINKCWTPRTEGRPVRTIYLRRSYLDALPRFKRTERPPAAFLAGDLEGKGAPQLKDAPQCPLMTYCWRVPVGTRLGIPFLVPADPFAPIAVGAPLAPVKGRSQPLWHCEIQAVRRLSFDMLMQFWLQSHRLQSKALAEKLTAQIIAPKIEIIKMDLRIGLLLV
jgi:hypothetical protein